MTPSKNQTGRMQKVPFHGLVGICLQEEIGTKGRGLVATQKFSPGALLLEEDPICWQPNCSQIDLVCHYCFRQGCPLMRCSRCKYARYCGAEHQKEAWRTGGHKEECTKLMACNKNKKNPSPTALMVTRILEKQQQQTIQQQQTQSSRLIASSSIDDFFALEHHYNEQTSENLIGYFSLAAVVKDLLHPDDAESVYDDGETMRKVVEILCRFGCNNHTICDAEMKPLGHGNFPLSSMINHSCRPNAVQVFMGRRLMLRAISNISPGDEITISYIDLAASKRKRQEELERRYSFKCCCVACEESEEYLDTCREGLKCSNVSCNGASTITKNPICIVCGSAIPSEHEEQAQVLLSLMEREFKEKHKRNDDDENAKKDEYHSVAGPKDRMEIWGNAVRIGDKVLHPDNIPLMRAHEFLLEVAIRNEDWFEAIKHVRHIARAYEKNYPPNSPLTGLQYIILGKLERNQGDVDLSISHLSSGLSRIQNSHGSNHPLVQEVAQMIQELKMAKEGRGSFE